MTPKLNKSIALISVLTLAACGSLLPTGEDGKTPARRFSLAMPATDSAPSMNAALRVEDFEAPAELAVDRIVVRKDAQEVLYAKGARWTDKPARLMRGLVSDYLKSANSAIVASATQIDVPITYRLSGRLSAFQVRVTESTTTATVRFEALLNNTRNRVPVARVFSAQQTATSDSPAAMAAAINGAANQVAHDVTAWVAQTAQ